MARIHACRTCEPTLPRGARPVLAVDRRARILVAGQAPGARVHESGVPWSDASGERLREWMGVTPDEFYDPARVAIVPMGFCYPGAGRSGDLPPRPECRRLWHDQLFALLANLRLRLVVGRYAQAYHLPSRPAITVTDAVADWRRYAPAMYPLPHPSPRNTPWLRRHPWFERDLLPDLRAAVRRVLDRRPAK